MQADQPCGGGFTDLEQVPEVAERMPLAHRTRTGRVDRPRSECVANWRRANVLSAIGGSGPDSACTLNGGTIAKRVAIESSAVICFAFIDFLLDRCYLRILIIDYVLMVSLYVLYRLERSEFTFND